MSQQTFPNYLQLREQARLSPRHWQIIRYASLVVALAVIILLLIRPASGLILLWNIIIPTLPLLFLVAPGIWRNICPLATANQLPRIFNFTRALTVPAWFAEYSYVIGFVAFFALASTRKWLFNGSGVASALLVLLAIIAAFFGGVFFKGKSGWCSSMCPLLPVQRLYNQTPLALVGNSHCNTCVGCNKNCYDFNPRVAQLADLYDEDRYRGQYRRFFAGAFPGFIVAFFTIPNPPAISIGAMYLRFVVYMLVSIGSYFALDAFWKTSAIKIPTLFAALAFNLFYWFAFPTFFGTITDVLGFAAAPAVIWVVRVAMLGLTVYWIGRTYEKEPIYLGEVLGTVPTALNDNASKALAQVSAESDQATVEFASEETTAIVSAGRTLLEVAENNGVPIEPGCRMGVCGADPVVVLSGAENLSQMRDDERTTLERLGLSGNGRMACVSRINGDVTVTLDLSQGSADDALVDFEYDASVEQVVIIGNGIAGVTAADHVRRRHPDCEIHLIGKESHHLYNRMGISRLIYGRSAMSGLYLMPEKWYDDHNITCWLNTQASAIDTETNAVQLATGDTLPYDRLILAMGSSSFVPPIKGVDLAGSFVLREAADAMAMRAYVQNENCQTAIIVGGGLLGLEAAYALHKLGLDVTVLERGKWLLTRQLDQRGAHFLQSYLEQLGLNILTDVNTDHLAGEERVERIVLEDGREFACDLFLLAVGVRSNLGLATSAEIPTNRGVLVNEKMQTEYPNIFAAGDVCEFDGKVYGLWPVAVEQARIAAINAIGTGETYSELVPVTALKVVGIELTSVGQFNPADGDKVIVFENESESRYRKLVIRDGVIVGAILLGFPQEAIIVADAVKTKTDVRDQIDALEKGDWEVLAAQ